MARAIQVLSYDPAWSNKYEQEARRISQILGPLMVAIHHIGSTAIPGVKAKPVIDILVEVQDIHQMDGLEIRMEISGYIAKGEFGIAGRRFFIKGSEEIRTHHVHVYQTGQPEIERHLNFRDYLKGHPAVAQAYSQLKVELAERFHRDSEKYTQGKTDFILEVEQKAKAWRHRQAFEPEEM